MPLWAGFAVPLTRAAGVANPERIGGHEALGHPRGEGSSASEAAHVGAWWRSEDGASRRALLQRPVALPERAGPAGYPTG
jgi:hypothetical protein